MRKRMLLAGFGVVCFGLGGVVVRAASGTPEIDRANATIGVQGALAPSRCIGEDSVLDITYRGTWRGTASQVTPDATDYPLTGSLIISGIAWTINTSTGRGMLTGTVSLTSSAAATHVLTGKLSLVSQGMPAAGSVVPARGWIEGKFIPPDDSPATPGDDYLMANVEFGLTTMGASGFYGDQAGTAGTPNFSVVTNVAPTAGDGVC